MVVIEGISPEDEEYCRLDTENSYQEKYGKNWKKKIWTLYPFNKIFVCVKDLVHLYYIRDREDICWHKTKGGLGVLS